MQWALRCLPESDHSTAKGGDIRLENEEIAMCEYCSIMPAAYVMKPQYRHLSHWDFYCDTCFPQAGVDRSWLDEVSTPTAEEMKREISLMIAEAIRSIRDKKLSVSNKDVRYMYEMATGLLYSSNPQDIWLAFQDFCLAYNMVR
jgi:hypothetical protein